jgi:UDP-N-acetylmuramoylalanine--D-glutamate ligase
MKIAIIGYDTEGRATYDYFARQGEHEITIRDQKTDTVVPSEAEAVLGDTYLNDLDKYDLIIRTAGMQPRKILEANPGVSARISTHVNEFFKASPTGNIIGITGTKGKGTTSSLVTQMLETTGKTVRLGGNIGVPPLTFIDELDADSWVVLELSSFQLMDLQHSPHVAVCLMVAPEHLDWHSSLDEYITAKEQLFARQTNGDVAIYFNDNETSKRIAGAGQGQKVPYYHSPGAEVVDGAIVIDGEKICGTDELKLLGRHNWQNACAAVTAVWYAALEACGPSDRPDVDAIRQVLTSFSGLEHRLELVRELNGVKYYDDSFGTTPETAIVALQAFRQPKVIILGGSDKGASYDDLAQAVKDNSVRRALLIGDQAGRIQTALERVGFNDFVPGGATMTEIVDNATSAAQSGDIILLSTGCASFGMFQNYKDRGLQFKQAVTAL